MTDDISEEVWLEEKAKLEKAIKDFYKVVDPDVYVGDWVLVVHKDTMELVAKGQSMVSTLCPTGQPFHRTTGLLLESLKQ